MTAFPFEAIANDEGVAPDEAWQRLVDGNARYVNGTPRPADYAMGGIEQALTQKPFAAILSFADCRVAPELTFDHGPGDLFVMRSAGTFTADNVANLDYAINALGTRLIVVLGGAKSELNVRRGVAALRNAGPVIGPAIASGHVRIVGARYDMATGLIRAV